MYFSGSKRDWRLNTKPHITIKFEEFCLGIKILSTLQHTEEDQKLENALWQLVKCSTGLIMLVSWVLPSTSLTKVRGTSALLSFGAISSTVHPNFPVWYAEWGGDRLHVHLDWDPGEQQGLLERNRTQSTKTFSPFYSFSPPSIESFRSSFPNGTASQPSYLLDILSWICLVPFRLILYFLASAASCGSDSQVNYTLCD